MERWKLILFDLDDTLYDFERSWGDGVKNVLRTHPATQTLDTELVFHTFKAHGNKLWPLFEDRTITMAEYRRRRFVMTLQDFGREIDARTIDDFNTLLVATGNDYIVPDPETVQLLEDLAQDYLLGIVTNGPVDQQYNKIRKLGIAHLFPDDTIFVSEELGFHKPDPRIYQAALTRFGVSASQALFVGDNWLHDIAGSIRAGLQAVWLNRGKHEPSTEDQPLFVIENLPELRAVLTGFAHLRAR